MIVFVNTFAVVAPAEEFERIFADTSKFLCEQPGFVSHCLVRSTTDTARYVNIAQWADEKSLRQATALPQFRAHAQRLQALAKSDPQFYSPVMERNA